MLPIGPSGETVAPSSHHGKIFFAHPLATSRHRKIQPKPCVQPRISSAWSLKPPTAVTTSDVKMHTSTRL